MVLPSGREFSNDVWPSQVVDLEFEINQYLTCGDGIGG